MEISLRRITLDDWPRLHEWCGSEPTSRYQDWGPNTPEETRHFAEEAVAAWQVEPLDRLVWVAEDESSSVVGVGELMVHDRAAGRLRPAVARVARRLT